MTSKHPIPKTAWVIGMLWVCWALSVSCRPALRNEVIVYAAQDQVYAEPILAEFTARTGIKTRAVYDSEAVKTVGLANRLLAERTHPQCDLFWGNEELRIRHLAQSGVFGSPARWAAFGYRTRRLVVNTNHLALDLAPRDLLSLTNTGWRGKIALAYPLFGTTATHFLALRQHWGSRRWEQWCLALQQNQPRLVDGNSVVVQLVGRGEVWIGLTDSDDIRAGQLRGLPVHAMPTGPETLHIPNTLGLVDGAPHPEAARRLYQFLQQPDVARQLIAANALEGASLPETGSDGLAPDWDALLSELIPATDQLREIFLRE